MPQSGSPRQGSRRLRPRAAGTHVVVLVGLAATKEERSRGPGTQRLEGLRARAYGPGSDKEWAPRVGIVLGSTKQ